jgi:hypothetical protein
MERDRRILLMTEQERIDWNTTGRNMASQVLTKEASVADALIGAPVGAVAAAIAAKKGDRKKAASRGLVLGALIGFIMGQRATAEAMKKTPEEVIYGEEEEPGALANPALASALAGLGAGLYYRGALPFIGQK